MNNTQKYNIVILACVGLLRTWELELVPYVKGQTLGAWCEAQTFNVETRLSREILERFDYEMSYAQVGAAVEAYLEPTAKRLFHQSVVCE